MNLENNIVKIIVYSLSVAFITKSIIVPLVKSIIMRIFYLKSKKMLDFSEYNKVAKEVRDLKFKPFGCIECMSFWTALVISMCVGLRGESAFIALTAYGCGCILEGIMMRYL